MAQKTVPIYLCKMGTDINGNAFPTYKVEDEFGFVTQDEPTILSAKVKNVESNDFYDEDGEQEWAARRLRLQAYTMSITFISQGSKYELHKRIEKFRNYLCGIEGTGTMLMLYEDWYKTGYKDVRLSELTDNLKYKQISEDYFVISFNVKFKVNDPLTKVELNSDGCLQSEDLTKGLVINGEELVTADNVRVEATSLIIL